MKKLFKIIFIMLLSILVCMPSIISYGTEESNTKMNYSYNTVQDENNNVTITMEAYGTAYTDFAKTDKVSASDIVVLFDQSKSMVSDREKIISSVNDIIASLPTPTFDAEGSDNPQHRVSIAGYGRIGLGILSSDVSSNSTVSTGTHIVSASYNTGVYIYNNDTNKVEFHSTQSKAGQASYTPFFKAITEGTADTLDTEGNTTAIGTMPDIELYGDRTYDMAFYSTEVAQKILSNPDQMCEWNAGASRLDAGMRIVKDLYELHNKSEVTKNRPFVVIMVCGTVPTQQDAYTGTFTSRVGCVKDYINELTSNGVSFFTLGDYYLFNSSNAWDTLKNFEDVMSSIAVTPYYYTSISQTTTVQKENKLQEFFQIVNNGVINAGKDIKITKGFDTGKLKYNTEVLNAAYDLNLKNATYYTSKFMDYDENNNPTFSSTQDNLQTISVNSLDELFDYFSDEITAIPSKNLYDYTRNPVGEKVVISVTGTLKNKITIATKFDDELKELGKVQISKNIEGTDLIDLEKYSDGIYKYPENGAALEDIEYYVFVNGKIVTDKDGNYYKIKNNQVLEVNLYSKIIENNNNGNNNSSSGATQAVSNSENVASNNIITAIYTGDKVVSVALLVVTCVFLLNLIQIKFNKIIKNKNKIRIGKKKN